MVDLQPFLLISLPPSSLALFSFFSLSYLYAIVMARHVDTEVESKPIQQFNVTKLCGTVKEIHHGFSRMQDLSMPSEREEGGRRSGEGGGRREGEREEGEGRRRGRREGGGVEGEREEEWRGRKREGGWRKGEVIQ